MNCLYCSNETSNPRFCSRSCAASFNNKLHPKHKALDRICNDCHKSFHCSLEHRSNRLCPNCVLDRNQKQEIYKQLTLADYHQRLSVAGKHPSWKNSHIRIFNRVWNREMTKLPCKVCGYVKHVELCHIKSVSSFPETTTLGEVNAPSNNIPLCPNHHWEFDHNLLCDTLFN